MVESETPPPATPPHEAGDHEVSLRRVSPDLARPKGSPMATRSPQYLALEESNQKIPAPSGVRSDILRDLLEQAAISEAHRTLMGTVVEKVLSAKSRLNEAFTILLTGFEVCDVIFLATFACTKNMPVYR